MPCRPLSCSHTHPLTDDKCDNACTCNRKINGVAIKNEWKWPHLLSATACSDEEKEDYGYSIAISWFINQMFSIEKKTAQYEKEEKNKQEILLHYSLSCMFMTMF